MAGMLPRPSREILTGFVLLCSLALGLMLGGLLRSWDQWAYDLQTRGLRAWAPGVLPQDVVVIGLDEAAYESLPEPYALWHRHLGELFVALAQARPAVVGVAAALPVRSYDFIMPGIDALLLDGVRQLAAAAPLVLGQTMGERGRLRPLAPGLLAIVGEQGLGSLALCEDRDGVVRRVNQQQCVDEDHHPALADRMAQVLGRDKSVSGLIDYTVGAPIDYLPLLTVLQWLRAGQSQRLQAQVQGRVVVVASLLPHEARYRVPVALAAWDAQNRTSPAALVHVQALRSLLGHGLIEPLSQRVSATLAVALSLLWFGRNGWRKSLLLVLVTLGVTAVSLYALWQGWQLPLASLLAVAVLAFVARLAWEGLRHYREKRVLRSAFAGHVSPQVLRAILRGQVQPQGGGQRSHAAILFVDIRGFTTLCEHSSPQQVMGLLNRYYAEVSAAVHRYGGSIDKFIGDGVLATFGVPQPLPQAERSALEAAQDLLLRLQRFNAELRARGHAPLQIGVGVHAGEVLVGYVGTRKRRDFTVIGDTVNIAARLQELSKTLGHPVICSQAVAAAVGFGGGMQDLGQQAVRGRANVHVWGWSPPALQQASSGAES